MTMMMRAMRTDGMTEMNHRNYWTRDVMVNGLVSDDRMMLLVTAVAVVVFVVVAMKCFEPKCSTTPVAWPIAVPVSESIVAGVHSVVAGVVVRWLDV